MEKDQSATTGGTDITAKYQKLASEYAKNRSQLNVLKKCIIDEQNKTAILTDELNERDKTIRKYEQEIDSYSFRNQQLEKRVSILQSDLMEKGKKVNKKQPVPASSREDNQDSSNSTAALEELLTKIDENVQLSRQMSQQEDAFQKQIADLSNSYEEKLKITSHLRSLVTELQNEKTSLLRSLEVANEEVKTAKQQICDLEEKVKNLLVRPAAGSGFTTESNVTSGTKSLCDLTTKLVKSQQETEFWKLEYELNKMKHSKTLLKYEEARNHLKSLGRDDLLLSVNEVTTPDSTTVTTMIGKMEVTEISDSGDGANYEKELIDYFTKRVNELIHLLQLCDRKAITFFDECQALQQHLALAMEDRRQLEETVNELKAKHVALSEELQLTRDTYETQVQTLTEHIANMNDKLTSQTDTISHLEFQLKHASKKK